MIKATWCTLQETNFNEVEGPSKRPNVIEYLSSVYCNILPLVLVHPRRPGRLMCTNFSKMPTHPSISCCYIGFLTSFGIQCRGNCAAKGSLHHTVHSTAGSLDHNADPRRAGAEQRGRHAPGIRLGCLPR